jgi:hypothetical protein
MSERIAPTIRGRPSVDGQSSHSSRPAAPLPAHAAGTFPAVAKHGLPIRLGRAVPGAVLAFAILGFQAVGTSVAAVNAATAPTCQSGHTLFERSAVRVFFFSSYDAIDKGIHQRILACLAHSKKPFALYDEGPFNGVGAYDFHILGNRLGFVADDQGISNGSETDIGWVDLRSGDVRYGALNAGENADKKDPLLPLGSIGYAIDPHGTVAVITGHACQVVAVLPVRAKPFEYGYRLGPPLVRFTAPKGGLDPSSVAITATTVTWRSVGGAPAEVPRSGGLTGTLSQTGGC